MGNISPPAFNQLGKYQHKHSRANWWLQGWIFSQKVDFQNSFKILQAIMLRSTPISFSKTFPLDTN